MAFYSSRVEHPEPSPPETSLELTFASDAEHAPAPPATDEPTARGPLGNLVVAHFRRVEIAMLGRVLISTLSGALPASMVSVERRRSLAQRLTGRAGEAIGITITAGDRALAFRAPEVGAVQASVGHVVHGVVLSSTPLPVAQWLDELGQLLDGLTDDDEATRVALERALLS